MFQIGAAVGTAIVSTVVFSRADAAGGVVALTEGLQAGFAACIVLAAVGLVFTLGLGPATARRPARARTATGGRIAGY